MSFELQCAYHWWSCHSGVKFRCLGHPSYCTGHPRLRRNIDATVFLELFPDRNCLLLRRHEKWSQLLPPRGSWIDPRGFHCHRSPCLVCYGNLWSQCTAYSNPLCSLIVDARRLRGLPVDLLLWCALIELAQCLACFLEQLCLVGWHDIHPVNP